MASTKRKLTADISFSWGGKTEVLKKGSVIDIGTGATATAWGTVLGGNAVDPSITSYGAGAREALGLAFAASNTS